MLSFEDCVAFSKLTTEEIEAIAEHEHIPAIVAAEYGNYLITGPDGSQRIRRIILEDIQASAEANAHAHVLALKMVLAKFVECHPEAAER